MKARVDKFIEMSQDVCYNSNSGIHHLPWTKSLATYDFGFFLEVEDKIEFSKSATLYRALLFSRGKYYIYRAARQSFEHFSLGRDRVSVSDFNSGLKRNHLPEYPYTT